LEKKAIKKKHSSNSHVDHQAFICFQKFVPIKITTLIPLIFEQLDEIKKK